MIKEVDKVYLINLDSSKDRLEESDRQLKSKNIKYERISAISGNSLKKEDYNIIETEGWNYNCIGLTLTTIKILEDAIENNYKSILIFEDDLFFNLHFNKRYKEFIENLPKDWDFFLLNFSHREDSEYVSKYIRRCKNSTCCQSYGINHSIFKVYLEKLKKINKPIDEHTVDLQELGTTYCPISSVVKHIENKYSTLREKVVNY